MAPVRSLLKRSCCSLANIVFPLRCLICNKDIDPYETIPLCREHKANIVMIDTPFCDKCGRQMVSVSSMDTICHVCREAKWSFNRSFSATIYGEVMRELVPFYKYGMRHYLAKPFAALMAQFMGQFIDYRNIDFVVPVPLHWRRYLYRGFNQAHEIVRHMAKRFPMKILRGNLRRVRNTVPQVMLGPKERHTNIVGAFRVVRPEEFEGKRVLLVDDVFTTGSTMNECARVLKEAGATEVLGFTLTQPIT